jgi:2-phospho-L-lactate/phosphoenolpyruvate guanylyltransferase
VQPPEDIAVVLPVKSFTAAKQRLGSVLSVDQRKQLAMASAERVVRAAAGCRVFVVCDDVAVEEWARGVGAVAVVQPEVGLDAAVGHGVGTARDAGHRHLVVAHSDLPLLPSPSAFAADRTITLVPDRVGDGTNVIAFPADAAMRFSYGAGSFRRHLAIALATGLAVRVMHDADAELDLDSPSDLLHPRVRPLVARLLDDGTHR